MEGSKAPSEARSNEASELRGNGSEDGGGKVPVNL